MKRLSAIWMLLLLLCSSVSMRAEGERGDSLSVSLLTCSPGEAVYELYGHTAIRIKDEAGNEDWVFNYGTFNFNTPNFVWRFCLGQTDYELGVTPYDYFFYAYAGDGRGIMEQTLNLSAAEKVRLCEALVINSLPENATYRYNFLYDNCTTRAVEQIENCIDGQIVFPKSDTVHTYRSIIHEFTAVSPWNKFGQDLVLGCETDEPLDVKRQMFSPIYAERYFADAIIIDSTGATRPLVSNTQLLLQPKPVAVQSNAPSPMFVLLLLLAISLAVWVWEIKCKKRCIAFDALLMLLQGCAGVIVAFLFFFSEHPAVGSNWLLLLLNPLPLFFLPTLWMKGKKAEKVRHFYYILNICLLTIFFLTFCLHLQGYSIEIFILALILLWTYRSACAPLIKK